MKKSMLLTSVAAAALVAASGFTPANAFDSVNWEWNKTITNTEIVDVNLDTDLVPVGLNEIEKVQVSIGDQTARATIGEFINNQEQASGEDGEPQVIDLGNLSFDGEYAAAGEPDEGAVTTNDLTATELDALGVENGPNLASGQVIEDSQDIQLTFNLGEITVENTSTGAAAGPFDAATELPLLELTATAVANVESVESDVQTHLHEGQFAYGGFTGEGGPGGPGGPGSGSGNSENSNLDRLAALSFGASMGTIEPANITATARAGSVLNGQADFEATAIANSHSVTLDAHPNDGVLIADLVQGAYANETAVATTPSLTVSNYTGLGALENPVASMTATAIGNQSNINVQLETAPTPTPQD